MLTAETQSGNTILVVDDHELVRNLIVTLLEDAGYSVSAASSGAEAIELVSETGDDIACLIQDLSLPEMPGEKIISEVLHLRSNIPIIVLSVDDETHAAQRLSGLSIAAYVQKPFDTGELLATVRAVVDEQSAT